MERRDLHTAWAEGTRSPVSSEILIPTSCSWLTGDRGGGDRSACGSAPEVCSQHDGGAGTLKQGAGVLQPHTLCHGSGGLWKESQ